MTDRSADIERIRRALEAAGGALQAYTPGAVASAVKSGDDPVTAADLEVDGILRAELEAPGEGWLSEETADDHSRLEHTRVWVVDPLDGTREFVSGIPEWCVSIGLVEDGRPVAGGVLAPQTGHLILGAEGLGVTIDGERAGCTEPEGIEGALVLASRSEVKRGEWNRFFSTPVSIRNMGSVALKLALVGAGRADATWTLVPKHEWDVAGGAAIVLAGGGRVMFPDGTDVVFNQPNPWLPGFLAAGAGLAGPIRALTES